MTSLIRVPPSVARNRPSEAPAPSFGDRVEAAFDRREIAADTRDRIRNEEDAVFDQIHERLGGQSPVNVPDVMIGRTPRPGPAPIEDPRTAAALRAQGRPWSREARDALLAAAAAAARSDPGGWGDLPVSAEVLSRQVAERLRAEYDEADRVLRLPGNYAWAADFLGEAAADISSPSGLLATGIGIAATPATGGLSLLPAMGRMALFEAGLGVGMEAALLPGEFEAADRLGLEPPNVAARLASAAVVGGALGAGIELVSQAVSPALRGAAAQVEREAHLDASAPPGAAPAEHAARLTAAERALAEGRPVPPPASGDFDGVVARIIGVESGGRADARNPRSTATGLGQFIESTWVELIGRHRPDIALNNSRADVLAMRTDPALARQMTEALTRENDEFLRSQGFRPTDADLYLAHFLGRGGARDALLADPDAPITAVMSPEAIAANGPRKGADGRWTGGLTYAGRPLQHWTVRDLRRWAETKMGQAVDPGDAAAAGTRRGFTLPDQVSTPQGTRVSVDYEVVDLDTLILASGARQPRDRSRLAPTALAQERAAALDPALLLPAPQAGFGAPVVGRDNVVDSGNGRLMSLRIAAERHPDRWDAYVAAIRGAGFDVPEGVARPVLIARRTTDLSEAELRQFVREANTAPVERMSATETARADADALDARVLGLFDPDAEVTAASNRAFVRALADRIPSAERGDMVDAQGALSAAGIARIRAALFARGYDDPGLLAAVAERGGDNLRGLLDAMTRAAAVWARMRAEIAAGAIGPEWDLTPNLTEAVRIVAEARDTARREGRTVSAAIADRLAQADVFTGGVHPATQRLVALAYRGGRARAADDVARALSDYAAEAQRIGTAGPSLLDEVAPAGPLDALDAIVGRLNREAETAPPAPVRDAPDPEADDLGLLPPDIRAADLSVWSDGAAAPAAIEAADQAEATLRRQVGLDPEPAAPAAAGPDPDAPALPTREERLAETADLIAAGDFPVKLADDTETTARAILRDLQDDVEFVEVLNLCGAGGANV